MQAGDEADDRVFSTGGFWVDKKRVQNRTGQQSRYIDHFPLVTHAFTRPDSSTIEIYRMHVHSARRQMTSGSLNVQEHFSRVEGNWMEDYLQAML